MPRSSKDRFSVKPLRAWRSGAMPSRGGVRSSTRSPKGVAGSREEDEIRGFRTASGITAVEGCALG